MSRLLGLGWVDRSLSLHLSLSFLPHTQVVQLEKDIRQRDFTIGQLKRQSNAPSPSVASEVRYLGDQVDSLERRGDTLQHSLDHERQENERISGELAAERQRGREVRIHVHVYQLLAIP